MDSEHHSLLRTLLERELDEATDESRLDNSGQVSWLAKQLDGYIDRWLGFTAIPSLPMQALLGSDLFAAVSVGTRVLSDHLAEWNQDVEVAQGWDSFVRALDRVASAEDRHQVLILRESYDAFYSTLRRRSQ